MLASGGIRPRDIVALARCAKAATRTRALTSPTHPDVTLAAGSDRSGVDGEVRRVVDRFLAGVVLDDTSSTSNAFGLLLIRMFLLGVPALPARGMQALPLALAAPLRNHIALNRPVTRIEPDGWGCRVVSPQDTAHAAHVVVATDPVAAAAFTRPPHPRRTAL